MAQSVRELEVAVVVVVVDGPDDATSTVLAQLDERGRGRCNVAIGTAIGAAHVDLGSVLMNVGELEEAHRHASCAVPLVGRTGVHSVSARVLLSLSRLDRHSRVVPASERPSLARCATNSHAFRVGSPGHPQPRRRFP